MDVTYEPSDTPLLTKALRARWSISAAKRMAILDHMVAIAGDMGDRKNAIRAFNAIVDAEKLDLAAAELQIKAGAVCAIDELTGALTTRQLDGVRLPSSGHVEVGLEVSDSELEEGVRRILDSGRFETHANSCPTFAQQLSSVSMEQGGTGLDAENGPGDEGRGGQTREAG